MFKHKAGIALLVASLYANSAWAVDDVQARLAELETRAKTLTEAMGRQIEDLAARCKPCNRSCRVPRPG